jgi:hypothetical protein
MWPRGGQLESFERVLCVGITGTRKTTWLKEEFLPHQSRVLVFGDRKRDWASLPGCLNLTVRQLEADPKVLAPAKVLIRVESEAHSYEALASEVCRTIDLVRHAGGDLVVILEDVKAYARLWTDREEGTKRSTDFELGLLACDGRDAAALVLVAQRTSQIPADAREQCSRVVAFAQSEDDTALLEERCGEDFAKLVRAWRSGSPPAIWTRPDLHPST